MKQIISFGGLGLVLILAVFAFRQCGRDGGGEYQTVVVTRGSITQAVTATGTLNPVVNVQVGSQLSGNIEKLIVELNSPVKGGEGEGEIDRAGVNDTRNRTQGERGR